MTEQSEANAIVELLRQQGDSLRGFVDGQRKQTEDLHAIRVEQAGMAARLEAMMSIPTRVSALEGQLSAHSESLRQHAELHASHTRLLGLLKSEADKRSGWSGPVGKIVVGVITAMAILIAGALLAVIGIRSAKASPIDHRLDDVANTRCWAAPAKRVPKYLYL